MRVTRWLKLRAVLAVGVLVLVAVELAGHRGPAVVVPQALLIMAIVVTVILDVRDIRRSRHHPGAP